jgi:biopolymer transport protein ExbD
MWKVRHEGSPQHLESTLDEIRQALADGVWEPTDEVMGPGETQWVAMENHPQLEELAAEIEPPPPHVHEDETRLDMTPLIDVCLVLLVFFMLTTTVAALQVRLEAPGVEDGKPSPVKVITDKELESTVILVTARKVGDGVVVKVEGEEVALPELQAALRRHVKKKSKMVLDADDDVPHDVVVQVIDAGKGVGLDSVGLAMAPPPKK